MGLFSGAAARGPWASVRDEAVRLAFWSPQTEVYSYAESVDACTLDGRAPVGTIAPPPLAFEGRLFNEAADVRWIAREDGTFDAWVTRESRPDDDPDRVTVAHPLARHYYLIGIGTSKPGVFTEARFPSKTFIYPHDRPAEHQRAYIDVVEYYRAAPNNWPADAGEIERRLNEPLLVAHRFRGVDAGED